jgi:sporulation protein YlmC with PRC-barrel domain
MRIKQEIIGKEVVDVHAILIGKVKDVQVDLENNTLEAFIVGKGGILEDLGISKDYIIIPDNMVIEIGDKILVKSEKQETI